MKQKSILITAMFALMLVGCKPKQVIHDRYITTVDSTAVLTLKEVINGQASEVNNYKIALEQSRQENTRLSNEILSHTINYDTAGAVDATTGKYPIASETTTSNKSVLDKTIKEHKAQVQEYEREIKAMAQKNSNLQYQVEALKENEKELKSKSIPAFSFKSFMWGVAAGLLLATILLFLKMR